MTKTKKLSQPDSSRIKVHLVPFKVDEALAQNELLEMEAVAIAAALYKLLSNTGRAATRTSNAGCKRGDDDLRL